MLAEQRAQGAPENDQLKYAVREELSRREVLSQEAGKKGLDKKADVQAQMDMARQAILIRAYLQEYGSRPKPKPRRSLPACRTARRSKRWPRNRATRARRSAAANWAGATRACT